MGQNIKVLRTRIKSVDSTLHLTKAMGLVASSKIRRANENMFKARQFSSAFNEIISTLSSSKECENSPYFQDRGENNTKIIVIAGDRGMAGGYNANIFKLIKDFPNAEIIPFGKRACDRYSKPVVSSEKVELEYIFNIAKELCNDFYEGKFDRLLLLSTHYESAITQTPVISQLLPLNKTKGAQNQTIFEPNEITILNSVVFEYVSGMIACALKESFACEVTARRTAMDSAGKNATEMISELQLEYNRARQGAITQEITEIVAGSGN